MPIVRFAHKARRRRNGGMSIVAKRTGHPSVAILLGGRRRDLNWLCCLRPFHEEVETLVLFFRQTSVCDTAPVKLTPVVGRLDNVSVRLISTSPRHHRLAEPTP